MKTKLLLLALLTAGFAQSQNLIQNGSFETFTGTTPNSWTLLAGSTVQETSIKNGGNSSLKGSPLSDPITGMMPSFQLKQEFVLDNLDEYTLKFDYFIPVITPSYKNIENFSYEISKITVGGATTSLLPMSLITLEFGVWQTVTANFKINKFVSPTTSVTMALSFVAGSMFDGSSIYFDNIIIAKTSTLGTTNFDKKSEPIAVVSKNEIKLNSEYKNSSYVIYTIDGKAVKRGKNNSSDSIEISDLTKGVYLLKLNDVSTSVKFIKE